MQRCQQPFKRYLTKEEVSAEGRKADETLCTMTLRTTWLASEWWVEPRLRSPGIQKQLGLLLATGVSPPYHHIRSDDWPAKFCVACCEAPECQIDNALVHIDDALVRIEADIGAAL